MSAHPAAAPETFANPSAERDYTIPMRIPEFTCVCPKTGQRVFPTLFLEYIPERLCLELKSLKLYIVSFRARGAFHEAITNEIADALIAALAPRFLRLTAKFNVRGGIYTSVRIEHGKNPSTAPSA